MLRHSRSLLLLRQSRGGVMVKTPEIRGLCHGHFSLQRRPEPYSWRMAEDDYEDVRRPPQKPKFPSWRTVAVSAALVAGGLYETGKYLKAKGRQCHLWHVMYNFEQDLTVTMLRNFRTYSNLKRIEEICSYSKEKSSSYYFLLLRKVLVLMEDLLYKDIVELEWTLVFKRLAKDHILRKANDEEKVQYIYERWLNNRRDMEKKRTEVMCRLTEQLRHESGDKFPLHNVSAIFFYELIGNKKNNVQPPAIEAGTSTTAVGSKTSGPVTAETDASRAEKDV